MTDPDHGIQTPETTATKNKVNLPNYTQGSLCIRNILNTLSKNQVQNTALSI